MRSIAPAVSLELPTCQRTRSSPPVSGKAAPRLSKESEEEETILPWVPVVEYVALPASNVNRLPSVAVPQDPVTAARTKVACRLRRPFGATADANHHLPWNT